MPHVYALANQKGGVGKTTSAVSLGAQLAAWGHKVLIVDFDPQGSASSGLGVSPRTEQGDTYDMFFGRAALSSIIVRTQFWDLDVAPSSPDLVGLEIEMGKQPGRELILKTQLSLLLSRYDFIFIDCPPSSGLLTLNALGAAEGVLIPLQAEYYALEGLSALINTISFVRQTFNPRLDVTGVFVTMYDGRTNLAVQVVAEAEKYFGEKMFKTKIPRNVRLSESPSHGQPVCKYDPSSQGAKSYAQLAQEVLDRVETSSAQVVNQ